MTTSLAADIITLASFSFVYREGRIQNLVHVPSSSSEHPSQDLTLTQLIMAKDSDKMRKHPNPTQTGQKRISRMRRESARQTKQNISEFIKSTWQPCEVDGGSPYSLQTKTRGSSGSSVQSLSPCPDLMGSQELMLIPSNDMLPCSESQHFTQILNPQR